LINRFRMMFSDVPESGVVGGFKAVADGGRGAVRVYEPIAVSSGVSEPKLVHGCGISSAEGFGAAPVN